MTEKQGDILIGVFFLSGSEREGRELVAAISHEFDHVQGLEIGANWEELNGDELSYQIGRYSHVVMYIGSSAAKSRWLAFVYGYCLGSQAELSIYSPKAFPIPIYMSGISGRFTETKTLLSHLHTSIEGYQAFAQVERAREELIGRGFGLNDEVLAQACKDGNQDVVALFFQLGFSVNSFDAAGVPLLSHAVRQQDEAMLRYLLGSGADPNMIAQDRGNSPLMDAAAEGHLDYAQLLISSGADLDIPSKNGQSALMMAVGKQHVDLVRALLKAGADTNLSDALGMTAGKYANLFKNEEILALFAQFSSES